MAYTRGTELDPLVDHFRHLSTKSRANEALHILQKTASIVKPIMRIRNWRVGMLCEFIPDDPYLLGLNENRGEKIYLRLRYPGDETQFLPFENVVDTMLHELCHIVHGPHDQAFNALWDKLRDEHETLLRKGYTGEGFLGKGNRLGGRGIPRPELQRQARAAAERRRQVSVLSQGSGGKVGGQGILRGQNVREIIAAAAEKRNRISRGCASATPDMGRKIMQEEAVKKEKVTTTKAEQADEDEAALMQAYIDMIQEEEAQMVGPGYVPPSQQNPTGGIQKGNSIFPPVDTRSLREQQLQIERQLQQQQAQTGGKEYEPETKPKATKPKATKPNTPPLNHPPPLLPQDEETWTCEVCTLINPINYLLCGACETERPAIYSQPANPTFPSNSSSSRSNSRPKPSQANTSLPRSRAYNAAHPTHPSTSALGGPRLGAADNIARFEAAAKEKAQTKPLGWTCGQCGTWMEDQWWTCSVCGRMKDTS
ncbi:uncharacterized protein Z520_05172 [Fonsecaea multimorphosa CBS 102226]|uniref:WLM domain-containing protein n=1 Tax=Fonsecaea multimorphosa CBS 102226 TaxID=1442371 RepID=A0A0D2INV6_9EURO|nr:uncharacterized protein Z520_05172 [Fonsecaea multimorphosa CBS 102226]KIX98711.1 hypothetical protein Z520_05172 [Fonsecaea multimorphosa CBS 102226]OAL32948.1 hypothetical protein AYO22_00033 [Fonsecaea multimorphosa]